VLSALAARLEPAEAAARIAIPLARLMDKVPRPESLSELALCLCDVAASLEPQEATRQCSRALTQALTKRDVNSLRYATRGLLALVVRLEPKEGAAFLLKKAPALLTDQSNIAWVEALLEVGSRMEDQQAADCFVQAMADTNGLSELSRLA